MFKMLIIINFVLILLSLASGIFFLAKDNGKSNRVVTSLTTRVVLSITLIALLLIGYFTGQIKPHSMEGYPVTLDGTPIPPKQKPAE